MKNRIFVDDVRDVPREYIALSDYNNTALAAELSALATKEKIKSYKVGSKSKVGRVYIHPADFSEVAKKYDDKGRKLNSSNKSGSVESLLQMRAELNEAKGKISQLTSAVIFLCSELDIKIEGLENE